MIKKYLKGKIPANYWQLLRKTKYWVIEILKVSALLPVIFWIFLKNYRFLSINSTRIGHLVLETWYFNKYKSIFIRDEVKFIILAPTNTVGNSEVVKFLRLDYTIISNKYLCKIFSPLANSSLSPVRYDVSDLFMPLNRPSTALAIDRISKVEKRYFKQSKQDIVRGENALRMLGVSENADYVCIHNRSSAYSRLKGRIDDFGQGYRNCSIENYLLAARMLVEKGFHVIRVGEPSAEKLISSDRIIDYANSEVRSDWLDLYILTNCKFFLGNSSGLFCLPLLNKIPIALANLAPISHSVLMKGTLTMPKLYLKNEKILSFADSMSVDRGTTRSEEDFDLKQITLIENSAEEIRDLCEEALARSDGTFCETEEDIYLQKKFRKLFSEIDFSYYGSGVISTTFLRKYKEFL